MVSEELSLLVVAFTREGCVDDVPGTKNTEGPPTSEALVTL